jgi:hypothetical protein
MMLPESVGDGLRTVCSSLYVSGRLRYNSFVLDPIFDPLVCNRVCNQRLQGRFAERKGHKSLNNKDFILSER